MDPRRSVLAIVIFIALMVAAWFFLAQGLAFLDNGMTQPQEPAVQESVTQKEALVLRHVREGDMHEYRGTVTVPTACHSLASSVEVSGGVSRTAHVVLSVMESETDTLCAQVTDEQEFVVSLTSREDPRITLELNGENIPLTVIEE